MGSEGSDRMMSPLEAWLSGQTVPPIASWLGMRLLSAGEGVAEAELTVRENLHNAMGTLHGGVYGDLADATMGAAIASRAAPGETFATTNLSVHLFSPVREGVLRARARLVRRGRRTGYAECDLLTPSGELAARAASECLFSLARGGGGEKGGP